MLAFVHQKNTTDSTLCTRIETTKQASHNVRNMNFHQINTLLTYFLVVKETLL